MNDIIKEFRDSKYRIMPPDHGTTYQYIYINVQWDESTTEKQRDIVREKVIGGSCDIDFKFIFCTYYSIYSYLVFKFVSFEEDTIKLKAENTEIDIWIRDSVPREKLDSFDVDVLHWDHVPCRDEDFKDYLDCKMQVMNSFKYNGCNINNEIVDIESIYGSEVDIEDVINNIC